MKVPASPWGLQWVVVALLLGLALAVRAGEVGWVGVAEDLVITLADGETVRLAELAPEVPAATLLALLGPEPLRVEPVGDADRSGQLPAVVWQGGGHSLQARLVDQGLARVWPTDDAALAAALLALEDDARAAGRGHWGAGTFRVLDAVPTPEVEGFAIIRGVVASVGRTDRFLYLNFGQRYRESVSARIRPRDGRAWRLSDQLDDWVGRTVEVRGFVFEDGGPMLELDHPAQLRVVD